MRVHTLERLQRLSAAPDEAFRFFSDASNLEAITPPWLRFRIVTERPIVMHQGTLIEYRLRLHGVPIRWLTRIAVFEPDDRFEDVQVRGPYRMWEHSHSFVRSGDGTLMRDLVRYGLPFGMVGELAYVAFVRRDLEQIFDHRREAVASRLGRPEATG
jgi:hypothetical protein